MTTTYRIAAIAFFTMSLISSANALTNNENISNQLTYTLFTPSNLKWIDAPETIPAGAKVALLEGNLNKNGSYIVRFKLPANYQIPAHSHAAPKI